MNEFKFDYQWMSKNRRWDASMYRNRDSIFGAVVSQTISNNKYSSSPVSFRISRYIEEFDGSLPSYVKNDLMKFCRDKLE